MGKIKLAVYMEDVEFRNRFTSCLLQFYGEMMEMHIYEDLKNLQNKELELADCIILEGGMERIFRNFTGYSTQKLMDWKEKIIWLQDQEEFDAETMEQFSNPQNKVKIVDKYENINEIVKYIRTIHPIKMELSLGDNSGNMTRLIGVYSLSETEMQLPFCITLGSILSEKEKVLLVDLQENSGLQGYCKEACEMGLEELIVMAGKSGKSFGSIHNCIGHIEKVDYVYPVRNSESLCQIEAESYWKVLDLFMNYFSYEAVIINFGSRFQGFFQMFSDCTSVYLLERKAVMYQSRKKEFMDELEKNGYSGENRVHEVDLPNMQETGNTCQEVVEQWKWGQFGNKIRNLCQKAVCYG